MQLLTMYFPLYFLFTSSSSAWCCSGSFSGFQAATVLVRSLLPETLQHWLLCPRWRKRRHQHTLCSGYQPRPSSSRHFRTRPGAPYKGVDKADSQSCKRPACSNAYRLLWVSCTTILIRAQTHLASPTSMSCAPRYITWPGRLFPALKHSDGGNQ